MEILPATRSKFIYLFDWCLRRAQKYFSCMRVASWGERQLGAESELTATALVTPGTALFTGVTEGHAGEEIN